MVTSCRTHAAVSPGLFGERMEPPPPAAPASDLGSAVTQPPLVVRHGPLRSVVADPKVADRNLPNAQCPDLAQVLFEHQSILRHLVRTDLFQHSIEFIQSCNHRLIFSRRTQRFLQPDRPACEHASRRHVRIAAAEYGVPRQHDPAHAPGESRGPARWSLRITTDEAMSDGFRLHDKMGHNTAIEIIRRTNAETCC